MELSELKNRSEDQVSPRFISASEISKYVFCNVSWYLDKVGAPRNQGSGTRIRQGIKSHSSLKRRYNSTRIATFAVMILMLAIIGYIFVSLY